MKPWGCGTCNSKPHKVSAISTNRTFAQDCRVVFPAGDRLEAAEPVTSGKIRARTRSPPGKTDGHDGDMTDVLAAHPAPAMSSRLGSRGSRSGRASLCCSSLGKSLRSFSNVPLPALVGAGTRRSTPEPAGVHQRLLVLYRGRQFLTRARHLPLQHRRRAPHDNVVVPADFWNQPDAMGFRRPRRLDDRRIAAGGVVSQARTPRLADDQPTLRPDQFLRTCRLALRRSQVGTQSFLGLRTTYLIERSRKRIVDRGTALSFKACSRGVDNLRPAELTVSPAGWRADHQRPPRGPPCDRDFALGRRTRSP
jgi:hypothetical protein